VLLQRMLQAQQNAPQVCAPVVLLLLLQLLLLLLLQV
jgi:hypothetical protein